jgi:hypothetical protein
MVIKLSKDCVHRFSRTETVPLNYYDVALIEETTMSRCDEPVVIKLKSMAIDSGETFNAIITEASLESNRQIVK